jgi:hypothetical protein
MEYRAIIRKDRKKVPGPRGGTTHGKPGETWKKSNQRHAGRISDHHEFRREFDCPEFGRRIVLPFAIPDPPIVQEQHVIHPKSRSTRVFDPRVATSSHKELGG